MTEIYRALHMNEREECLNLWLTVWPGESSRTYFERYFYGDIEWLPYYTQVVECDGRLVSAVQICKRTVACGEFKLTMGGIANVATLPEYRGRGYNTGCLKNAIDVMEADAMDFALLFTSINAYYRKFGVVDLPRVRATVQLQPDFRQGPTSYITRPAVAEDMPAVRRIYEIYNWDRPISVQRTEAYWRDWIRFDPDSPPASLLVACSTSGIAAGYCYSGVFNSAAPYDPNDAGARIVELCVDASSEDEEEAITRSLLNKVIAGLQRSRTQKLVLEVALTPALKRVLVDLAVQEGIELSEMGSGMARLLHKKSLLQSVCMCANERWRAAGSPAGKLAFETPYGTALLDAAGALPRVADSDVGFEAVAPMSQSDLFSLLFGSFVSHRATGDKGLLSALFPRRDMVFWGVDGF